MTDHDHVTLVLDVDVAATPITGHLTDAAGAAHVFHGWIGLLALLDTALEPAAALRADPAPVALISSPDGISRRPAPAGLR
jgi:hypothetical protein